MRTFYDILGISRNATQEEIIAAYRKRCLETHPDRGGDETAFLNVRKGYEILSNPNKRIEYDKWVKAKEDIEKKSELSVIKKRLEPWIGSFLTQYCQDCDLRTLIMTYFYGVDSIYNNINKTKLNKILTAEIVKNILLIIREDNAYKLEPVLSLDSICNDVILGEKDIRLVQDGKKNNTDTKNDADKGINDKLRVLSVCLLLLFGFGIVGFGFWHSKRITEENKNEIIKQQERTSTRESIAITNRKKLYEALKQEGYDNFADEKEFNAYVENPENRKKLFNALKEEGYDNFANEKEFDDYLGFSNNSKDKDYISQLYDAIFSVYARFDDEDSFREWILIKENAESIYDLLEAEGYEYEGTKEDFLKRIGVNTAKDLNHTNRNNEVPTSDSPKNSERHNVGKNADVGKVLRDANNAVDRALNRYKVSGDGIDTKVNIGEEPAYKETVFQTGDCPYSDYYGYGGGIGQFDKKSLSELKILNYSNSESVVLLETVQGVIIRNVYIKNNSEYTMTNIPEGKYRIKIMYGNSWNSEKDNGRGYPKGGFMKNVSFSKSKDNDLFDFIFEESYEGISYPTYSITLHKVKNGNMQTERISKDDFF